MFECRSENFKTNSVPFTHVRSKVLFVVIVTLRVDLDCNVFADVDNGWGECIMPIANEIYAWNVRFDSRLIFLVTLNSML